MTASLSSQTINFVVIGVVSLEVPVTDVVSPEVVSFEVSLDPPLAALVALDEAEDCEGCPFFEETDLRKDSPPPGKRRWKTSA